jgi:hypothetical protein
VTKEEMVEAFWLSVLRRNGFFTDYPQLEVEFDDITAEYIRLGIIEYNPETDTMCWIGPAPGSPEYEKLIEQIQIDE